MKEYIDGPTLAKKIQERKETQNFMSEDELINIFVQIADAIKYIHDISIVHGNLTTANVYLTS